MAQRLDQARDDERQRELRRDDDHRVQDGVAERLPEDRIFRERDEVLEPDPLAADDRARSGATARTPAPPGTSVKTTNSENVGRTKRYDQP